MQKTGSTSGLLTRLSSAAVLALGLTGAAQAALVGHYTFDGNADDSATADGAQNLTLSNGAALTSPGIVGSAALSLDGTNDYASATSNFTAGTQGVTLAAWFTPDSTADAELIHMAVTGATNLAQSAATLEIAGGQIRGGGRSVVTDGFQSRAVSQSLTIGQTYFAATVIDYENDTVTTYLYDGENWFDTVGSGNVTFGQSTGAGDQGLNIGRRADNARYFNGVIDEVQIYNHRLSGTEVQALIPEPASLALLGFGGLLMLSRTRELRRA